MELPATPKPRRTYGRTIARIFCLFFAGIGLVPLLLAFIVKLPSVRHRVALITEKEIAHLGISARYDLSVSLWPLAVELGDVSVDSSDRPTPFLTAKSVRARPRFFPLLSGKLTVDQVDIDSPSALVIVSDGKLKNLAPDLPKSSSNAEVRLPLGGISISNGTIHFDIDGVHTELASVDLDLVTEDLPGQPQRIDAGLQVGRLELSRSRSAPEAIGGDAIDDDVLCGLDLRGRLSYPQLSIFRLNVVGAVDLDPNADTPPECPAATDDKRRIELLISRLTMTLPRGQEKFPPLVRGHVKARAPLSILSRFMPKLSTDGWLGVDLEGAWSPDMQLPNIEGSITGRTIRIDRRHLAKTLESRISIVKSRILIPEARVGIADGLAVIRDVHIDPFGEKAPFAARLDADNINFNSLMRDLDVHPNSSVAWDVLTLRTGTVSGTLAPLQLDGDFTALTKNFAVYDRPANDITHQRIFGVASANIQSRLSINSTSLKFLSTNLTVGNSTVRGAAIHIGFNNDAFIDVNAAKIDLRDVSPIGKLPFAGVADVGFNMTGTFSKPVLVGEVTSLHGFKIADIVIGDLKGSNGHPAHVKVDVDRSRVEISGISGENGEKNPRSRFEVPSAVLDLGRGGHGFLVDSLIEPRGFEFQDFIGMFPAAAEDPRFAEIHGRVSGFASLHLAIGGPEDRCGGGFIGVRARTKFDQLEIVGERFADGEADFDLNWFDRTRGIAGADIDVHSFTLYKNGSQGTRGTMVGSALFRRGSISATASADGMLLSQLNTLQKSLGDEEAANLEGLASATVHVGGNLDEFSASAGLDVQSEVRVESLRVRNIALPRSDFRVDMHQIVEPGAVIARSACGGPIGRAFDKASYLTDHRSKGTFTINGNFLGNQLTATNVVISRETRAEIKGKLGFRGLELRPVYRAIATSNSGGKAPVDIVGKAWGDVVINQYRQGDLPHANIKFWPERLSVTMSGNTVTIPALGQWIELANDRIALPAPVYVKLETASAGAAGGFAVTGGATDVSKGKLASMNFVAALEPIDLQTFAKLSPSIERALGKVEGRIAIGGKFGEPVFDGRLSLRDGETSIKGLPAPLTRMFADVRANANELTATFKAKMGTGTIDATALIPMRGFSVAVIDASAKLVNIRINPQPGVAVAFNGDVGLNWDFGAVLKGIRSLPTISGTVDVTSFEYTKPVKLTTEFGTAKRTVVDHYDPTADTVALDIRVRSSQPFIIHNNLAEASLRIDSDSLHITGTNQRFGARGSLKTLDNGHFHFRASDFDIRQGQIRFDDATRIAPTIDLVAVTDYRRATDAGASSAAAGLSTTSGRGYGVYRITLHAYGEADNPKIDLQSEPNLSREDILLLLAIGMTRAELDQLQASSIGASIALNYAGAATGADKAVKDVIPIIDDFRFGSAYSSRTGRTEPQVTIGKRLGDNLRASVTTGVTDERELRANIEYRFGRTLSVQLSYDNVTDVQSSSVGNLGGDLRWRLEFE